MKIMVLSIRQAKQHKQNPCKYNRYATCKQMFALHFMTVIYGQMLLGQHRVQILKIASLFLLAQLAVLLKVPTYCEPMDSGPCRICLKALLYLLCI